MKRLYKIKGLFIALMLMLAISVPGYAANDGTITVEYKLSNVHFELYKIEPVNNGKAVTARNSKEYPVSLESENVAATLEAYISENASAPIKKGFTNEHGIIKFDGLEDGVYLLCGKKTKLSSTKINAPVPVIIELPYKDENGFNNRVLRVQPKSEEWDTDEEDVDYINISVLKKWNDDEKDRPDSITVKLLKDNEVYKTVELSKDNNWRYVWKDADLSADWGIIEDPVPDGYTVDINKTVNGDYYFLITNTKIPVTPDNPNNPDNPDTPDKPNEPVNPDNPVNPDKPSEPETDNPENKPENNSETPETNGEKLPQTGQLWWPVPLLSGIGLVLLLIGIKLSERNTNDEKQ